MSARNGQAQEQAENTDRRAAPLVRRDTFEGEETALMVEQSTAAQQARATAMVQARFVMGRRFPRKFEIVRERTLAQCKRPSFAERATYALPRKKKNEETGQWETIYIRGPSIRLVEAIVASMGHIYSDIEPLTDDALKRTLLVTVTDYETCAGHSAVVTVEKNMERKSLKKGEVPIGRRKNSYGDDVYLLPITDDELRLKENRLVSMMVRTVALRLIPADLKEEAFESCLETQRQEDKRDPKAALRKTLDNFATLGIKATDVLEYLGGKSIEDATPDQIRELRAVGLMIQDGMASWAELLATSPHREHEPPAGGDQSATPDPKAAEARRKVEELIAKKKGSPGAATPAKEPASTTGKPASAAPKGVTADRRAKIAEQAGVPLATVELVEKLQGEGPEMILRSLRAEKLPGDEVVVADILAQLKAAP